MKENKKVIIVVVIALTIAVSYFIFKPDYYYLRVNTGETSYDYANGILVKNFLKSSFYLNVNFDDPNDHCSIGLFLKNGDYLKTLEAFSGTIDGECRAIVTESGYSLTNKEFSRIEKNFRNGNIINQMLENKEQVYLCISANDINSITKEDCHQVEFEKK